MPYHDCMIIANPNGKAWDFACSIYQSQKRRGNRYNLNEIYFTKFRDGEIRTKVRDNIRKKNCFFVHDSSLEPTEWLTQLIFANETMKNSSANEVIDILPYLKFSRQDRKDESRVAVNAKAVADIINKYANRLLTLDVHNLTISMGYDIPFDNLYSFPVASKYLKEKHQELLENLVIISPDAGGGKRAESFLKRLGTKDLLIGYKYREEAGEIAKFMLPPVNLKGKNVLVIDDIIDSGNTLIEASNEARKMGAERVYAYCTHGVFSENAREKITKEIDLMIVSNTISQPIHENIEVVPLDDFFAEAICRTNKGDSLSELFE